MKQTYYPPLSLINVDTRIYKKFVLSYWSNVLSYCFVNLIFLKNLLREAANKKSLRQCHYTPPPSEHLEVIKNC